MKKSVFSKFMTVLLSLSLLITFSLSTAFASEKDSANFKDSSTVQVSNPNIIKATLVKSTSEIVEFEAPFYVQFSTANHNSISPQSEVPSYGKLYASYDKSNGILDVYVDIYGWARIKYGTMNGMSTNGAVGSRSYRASINVRNDDPGPFIEFQHSFTGLSMYRSGTQYVHSGSGTLTCVDGYGSFASADYSFEIPD